eukprot:4474186-Pleurochrysis_carterae.AAC.1
MQRREETSFDANVGAPVRRYIRRLRRRWTVKNIAVKLVPSRRRARTASRQPGYDVSSCTYMVDAAAAASQRSLRQRRH